MKPTDDAQVGKRYAQYQPFAAEPRPSFQTHPAQALDTDVIGIGSAGRPVDDSVPELIVGRAAGHPAEQLTPVLHQD